VVQSPAFQREAAAVRALAGVEQVQFDWEWVERLRRLVSLINMIGMVAGGLLAIAAAFTIANVIRLTMMLYREEIEIMRLVGATERIIRGPFLIEGVLQGLLGAVAAIVLLVAIFLGARRFLVPANSLLFGFLFNGFPAVAEDRRADRRRHAGRLPRELDLGEGIGRRSRVRLPVAHEDRRVRPEHLGRPPRRGL